METLGYTPSEFLERYVWSSLVARMYYQEGLPIPMALEILNKNNRPYDISIIAQCLYNNGWPEHKVRAKLKEDFADSGEFFADNKIILFT